MIVRTTAVLLLSATLGFAQLQLYWVDAPGSEKPVGESFDVGTIPAGDTLDTKFRIRNLGDTAEDLERLRASGVGFSLEGYPSLPYVVAAGTNVDFRVRFQPPKFGSYSANLRINDSYVLLFGSSPPSLVLSVVKDGRPQAVGSQDTILFGMVEGGSTSKRQFLLANPAMAALAITSFSITEGAFHLAEGSVLPPAIEPGEQVSFAIRFEPPAAGIYHAELSINQRRFLLEGVGSQPPFPAPGIVFDKEAFQSGEQGAVVVELTSPSPASGTGELHITFAPSIEGPDDDPAIQFLANSSRTIDVSVREGKTKTLLGGQPSAVFQTGTTAGTITFTLKLGAHVVAASLTLPPSPVVVESGSLSRTATGLELRLSGFDNTQSASDASFTFLDKQGQPLGAGPIRASVADAFQHYFRTTQLGGMFSLTAEFPVAGNASLIAAAEVEFTNNLGRSEQSRFPVH